MSWVRLSDGYFQTAYDSLHHDKVSTPMPNIQPLLHRYYAATAYFRIRSGGDVIACRKPSRVK